MMSNKRPTYSNSETNRKIIRPWYISQRFTKFQLNRSEYVIYITYTQTPSNLYKIFMVFHSSTTCFMLLHHTTFQRDYSRQSHVDVSINKQRIYDDFLLEPFSQYNIKKCHVRGNVRNFSI